MGRPTVRGKNWLLMPESTWMMLRLDIFNFVDNECSQIMQVSVYTMKKRYFSLLKDGEKVFNKKITAQQRTQLLSLRADIQVSNSLELIVLFLLF